MKIIFCSIFQFCRFELLPEHFWNLLWLACWYTVHEVGLYFKWRLTTMPFSCEDYCKDVFVHIYIYFTFLSFHIPFFNCFMHARRRPNIEEFYYPSAYITCRELDHQFSFSLIYFFLFSGRLMCFLFILVRK